jgi:diguanylate cyclase (GGDEF)-like protein
LVAGPDALVTRYGGEEFVVALSGVSDPVPMLDRFLAAVDDLAVAHDDSPTGRLTISCGCVVAVDEADLDPWSLLSQCDEALYEAKSAGRDRYVLRVLRRGVGHH